MTFITLPKGASIATAQPDSSKEAAVKRTNVHSLADLLVHLNSQPTTQTPMLRSTAAKIAAFLGTSPDDIPLDLIQLNREGFRRFLESRRHNEGGVRSYVNYLRILMNAAQELGWQPYAGVSRDWQIVLDAAGGNDCVSVVKWLATVKDSPSVVTEGDFDAWILQRTLEGERYPLLRNKVNACWHTLIACGYTQNAPRVYFRKRNYGVPLSDFPLPLRNEVTELLRWKTVEFEPDRPKNARIRSVSAKNLRHTLSKLYGYATKIAGFGEINCLTQLIQKRIIAAFISWCINEQKVEGAPLVPQLRAVLAAVSEHPAHKSLDFSWFRPLLDAIPTDDYAENIKLRKAKKYLDYAVLESIPAKVRAAHKVEAKHGERHIARLVMGELMIAWMLVLPWRQRNIRECRVAGPNPNLFKSTVPTFSSIDKPEWARIAQSENPATKFWQVKFSPKETKTKVPVHIILPRHLVALLEEYLTRSRPILLGKRKCDTLFPLPESDKSDTENKTFINDVVSEFTLRYGGRRVTPHLFRDIVAFAWLKDHPKDYLTLSKLLWHKDVQTTINYYGNRFNESSATVAIESWHEERAKGASRHHGL